MPAPSSQAAALGRRNLPLMLLQAREAVISRFRPMLTEQGLTEQQWRVIRLLNDMGELEPWELSRLCQILKPSLTGLLGRLETAGLVTRRRHPSDQRRQVVAITDRCRALVRDIAPSVEQRYDELERDVGAELISELYDVLDRLLAAQAVALAPPVD